MSTQPTPDVTGADVERVVRRDFPADRVPAVLAMLEEYGAEKWQREAHRVRLAVLKLAAGSLRRLRQELEGAKHDYREVLGPAEYPGYTKRMFRIDKLAPEEQQRVIDADWKQYQDWLTRTSGVAPDTKEDLPPTLEEFKEACRHACGFLVAEHGFQEMPEPRQHNDFSVRFRRDSLGIDVYGEGWGEFARCDLVHGDEQLGLVHLVPDGAWPSRSRGPRPGQLEQIATIGALLGAHCTDFLTGDVTRFAAELARWKERTRPRPVSAAQLEQRAFDTACSEAGHAFKRGDLDRVIELLAPHAARLGRRHAAMLEAARDRKKPG